MVQYKIIIAITRQKAWSKYVNYTLTRIDLKSNKTKSALKGEYAYCFWKNADCQPHVKYIIQILQHIKIHKQQ